MDIPEPSALAALIQANSNLLIKSALTIVLAWIASWVVNRTVRRLRNSITNENGNYSRLLTLISLGSQIVQGLIWAMALFTVLATFGINLTPIITSLGVAGLAVSLGAQTLIKDYFGGLMILVENQYTVGDWINVGPVSGTVENLTLRLTTLRDINGKLHYVPNGEVRVVTNSSRDWLLAIVDLNLELETDLDYALGLLEEAMQRASADEALGSALIDSPKVQGWHKLLDWAVQIRLSARTHPDHRLQAEIAMRRYALDALNQGGVRLARQVIDRVEK